MTFKNGSDTGNIRKPPEKSKDRPTSTLDEQEVLHLPSGEEIPTSWTSTVKDPVIGQVSRVKHKIPVDLLRKCENPWEEHSDRHFFKGYGGEELRPGLSLCNECMNKNERKIKIRDIFIIGWIITSVWNLEICE